MKTNSKFFAWALAASALVGAVGTACTSEETDGLLTGSNVVSLVKAPDIVAYSGDVVLGNTFLGLGTTRATYGEKKYYKTYDGDFPEEYKSNIPGDITQDEIDYVLNYIKNHPDEGGYTCNLTDFFIQNIGSSKDKYSYTYINGEANNLNPDGSYKDKNNTRSAEFVGGNQMDALYIGGTHVPDYNASWGPTALCLNWTVEDPTYHDTWGTEDKTKENAYKYYIIEYPEGSENYNYYLGFDYRTKKWDNGDIDFQGDGVYNDWVVKLTPADGSKVTPETPTDPADPDTDPETPETPGEPCPGCGHDLTHHEDERQGGTCSDCAEEGTPGTCFKVVIPGEGEIVDPGFTGPTGPDVNIPEDLDPGFGVMPEIPEFKDEVEVNLHADEKGGTLESHLSIHVRAATDVEIFIPVPEEYYCEADDMLISQIHDKNHSIHGGPYETTYVLQDKEDGSYIVTLNLEFVEGGIRIWTEGITQEVIDFCYKHYKDGINFEVWNYFEDDLLDLEGLKGYLNQATIKFLDKEPDAYINAFNEAHVGDGVQEPNDCTVNIVEDQADNYAYLGKGEHKNASHFNDIYAKKGAEEKPATPPTPPVY